MTHFDSDDDVLQHAFEELSAELPEPLARALARLRLPHMRWLRVGLGVSFVLGGLFAFLPVLGIELLPLGLMFLAHDIACLRRPVGRGMLWLMARWRELKARFRKPATI